MAGRIVRGCVNANGGVYSGTGSSVQSHGDGIYIVVYDEPFAGPSS